MVARYRGGGHGGVTGGESSMESLDDDDDDEDEDDSQSSYQTRESVAAAGGTETLPCGGTVAVDAANTSQRALSITVNDNNQHQSKTFQWTLSNWGASQAARRRNNSGTVRVDLASPEDISLDTDNSSRVVFSAYGTTV